MSYCSIVTLEAFIARSVLYLVITLDTLMARYDSFLVVTLDTR